MGGKKKVIFMCVANSCRSQMAEGLANYFLKEKIEARSGGSSPAMVNPYAVKVMQEIGIDISKQYSKSVNDFINEKFDYAISLCGDPAHDTCPVFFGQARERFHWPFPDPAETQGSEEDILSVFREVRDEIKNQLLDFFKS